MSLAPALCLWALNKLVPRTTVPACSSAGPPEQGGVRTAPLLWVALEERTGWGPSDSKILY